MTSCEFVRDLIHKLWKVQTHVSAALLFNTSDLKVLISQLQVSLHLLQSLRCDRVDSQLLLALSKTEPQLAPCRVSAALAEKLGHLGAAVAARQGCLVGIVGRRHRNGKYSTLLDVGIFSQHKPASLNVKPTRIFFDSRLCPTRSSCTLVEAPLESRDPPLTHSPTLEKE